MNKIESVFINGIGGGLLGATLFNWDRLTYTIPLFLLVVAWGIYLEKLNDKETE